MPPLDLRNRILSHRLQTAIASALPKPGTHAPELQVNYVRSKGRDGTLVGLEDARSGAPFGYLKLFDDGGSAACAAKYEGRFSEGAGVSHLPAEDAVLFRFPADRRIRALPYVADMGRLKHVLHGGVSDFSPGGLRIRARRSVLRVLKYKPERRALWTADLALRDGAGRDRKRRIVVQVDGTEGNATAYRALRFLERLPVSADFRTPRVTSWDAERRVMSQEWLSGETAAARLPTERGADACRRVGRAISAVHTAGSPEGLAPRPPDSLYVRAGRVLDDLAGICPDPIRPSLDAARVALDGAREATTTAPPACLVHGDLHYHQALLPADDGPAALLDWDEAAAGDPREDTACFLAHLHLRELQGALSGEHAERLRDAFRDGYGRSAGSDTALLGAQLILLSMVPARNLRAGWIDETRAILERAEEFLSCPEGAPR